MSIFDSSGDPPPLEELKRQAEAMQEQVEARRAALLGAATGSWSTVPGSAVWPTAATHFGVAPVPIAGQMLEESVLYKHNESGEVLLKFNDRYYQIDTWLQVGLPRLTEFTKIGNLKTLVELVGSKIEKT